MFSTAGLLINGLGDLILLILQVWFTEVFYNKTDDFILVSSVSDVVLEWLSDEVKTFLIGDAFQSGYYCTFIK